MRIDCLLSTPLAHRIIMLHRSAFNSSPHTQYSFWKLGSMDADFQIMEMQQYMDGSMLLIERDLSKHAPVVGENRQPAYYPRDCRRMAIFKDNMKIMIRYMYTLSTCLLGYSRLPISYPYRMIFVMFARPILTPSTFSDTCRTRHIFELI